MQFTLTREYLESLAQAIERQDQQYVRQMLNELYPADIAEILEELDLDEAKYVFSLLDEEEAADVLMELQEDVREDFLENVSSKDIAQRYIDNLDSDDAADLISELPHLLRSEVLSHVEDAEQAANIADLLNYPEDSAGSLMAKELVKVNIDWTVTTCLREIRRQAEEIEQFYNVYAVNDRNILQGIVSLKRIMLSPTKAKVIDIYEPDIHSVNATISVEEVASIMQKYDLVVLPVVDDLGRLLGRITIDDVVDVITDEADKDYQLMSGISENVETTDNIWILSRARLPWLLVALFGGVVGSRVLSNYEPQIQIYPEMAFFMPLIAAMGGNVGVQSSALVVQGLANDSLSRDGIIPKLFKEFSVGLLNAMVCASLLLAYNIIFDHSLALSFTVSIALVAVISFAAIFGTFVPLALDKFKIDPALATGPFITTSNDIIGLFIYFMLGRLMYGVFP
ncbi:MAG: magnesium transporter [Bacteroidales bacterium]|nr:magnesium transporter [Bacteroidales bacterium]MDZ4203470.1 magnesium transporter [Bacteroidales bacterium]